MSLDIFRSWMGINTKLSENSIYKYTLALNTISNDMLKIGLIDKPLIEMNLIEIDFAIASILSNADFIAKNTKGNKMYSNSLKQYRFFAFDTFEHIAPIEKMIRDIEASDIAVTEKQAIIKSRIGQGQYRDDLLAKYDKRCVITGIDHAKLLIASHIKPWNICENNERLDAENGLLLSANMDKLFDSGLVTFDNMGKMFVSSFVSDFNRKKLNIDQKIIVDLKASARMLNYLEFHRDVLFVR